MTEYLNRKLPPMRAAVKAKILFFLSFLIIGFPLLGFEETLVLGEEDRWARLSLMDNLQFIPGLRGYPDLTLRDGEYRPDSAADLLLHFNQEPILPPSPTYRILRGGADSGGSVTMAEKVFGAGAAAFTTLSRGLEWEPASDTLLGAGASPKDFTLEFWLYPIRLSEGEEVFSWIGMQTLGEKQRPQGVYGRITNRKLGWEFFNFFQTSGDETTLFTLMGLTPLLPRRWNHHLVRYDSRIGLLEYLVNGEIEAIIHTTPSQKESSEIYAPLCGDAQPPKITLGGSYLGLIEEFRLSKRFITEPQLTQFTLEAGTAQTAVLDLGQPGARFSGITAKENLRGSSIVTYAYRQSETLFRAEDLEPAWRLLSPGESLPGDNRGRYLQLKMDFLADGSGHWAPRLSSLMIKYKKDILPLAPMNFRVEPGDQKVDLRWNRLGNAAAEGYRLYFGTSPGIYFGDTQGGQKSPIDVGNVDHYTLEGLTNGTLYYFALVAYGGYRGKLTSEYSVERSARPTGYRSDPP